MSSPTWSPGSPGVLVLPSGRALRGRGLRKGFPGGAAPELGLYLLARDLGPMDWERVWVPWPDFRLPRDDDAARRAFVRAWAAAADRRVEVACGGGRGRTGTALACIAVLDGVDPADAVAYVREHYDHRAVETPWQRRYVERFTPRSDA